MKPGDLLELDWEVGVFRAVRALWRWAVPQPLPYDASRAAHLQEVVRRLSPLAQLVAGMPVRVLPARSEGGVRGRDLLLPPVLDVLADAEANRGLYVLRAVHAAGVARLCAAPPPSEPTELLRASLEAALASARLLREELAAFGPAWDEVCAALLAARPALDTLDRRARATELARQQALRGGPLDPSLWAEIRASGGPAGPPVALWGSLLLVETDGQGAGTPGDAQLPDGTEQQAPAVEALRRALLDPKAQEDHVVYHTFEKVETVEPFSGNTKTADGSDELEEHLEALDEVDLRELVRDGTEAHSIYKAELDVFADIPDVERIAPGEAGLPYDEWDYRSRSYRQGWCTVYPSRMPAALPGWGQQAAARHRRLIATLRQRLEDHRSRLRPQDRQTDGEQPDIDALVDHLADVRAGRTGSNRLYIRQQRQRRDFATTVLLDVSLSSDGWVDDRRVLDVSREAVLVLGEVADALQDRLEVLAFASSTRNRCRVWTLKAWGEPWALGRARLGALEPQGYTRIGPALRHATRGLLAAPADRRLLLLISDGKPNDYDRYEGQYGMADVRKALREAEQAHVVAHALAVDAGARAWLPSMFGPGRWHVLPTPDHLLPALTEVYGRLTGR
jgi:nitric oxide reductase NorD protein